MKTQIDIEDTITAEMLGNGFMKKPSWDFSLRVVDGRVTKYYIQGKASNYPSAVMRQQSKHLGFFIPCTKEAKPLVELTSITHTKVSTLQIIDSAREDFVVLETHEGQYKIIPNTIIVTGDYVVTDAGVSEIINAIPSTQIDYDKLNGWAYCVVGKEVVEQKLEHEKLQEQWIQDVEEATLQARKKKEIQEATDRLKDAGVSVKDLRPSKEFLAQNEGDKDA